MIALQIVPELSVGLPTNQLPLSLHATRRMCQRNLSEEDLLFVYTYGTAYKQNGATVYFLGKHHIPAELLRDYGRLEGTVLICASSTDEVITVYRNRHFAFRQPYRNAKKPPRKYRLYRFLPTIEEAAYFG